MEELLRVVENKKKFAKHLKKGKLFAIQYLTRRIQVQRNKKGTTQQVEKNTRKADRLKEEIDYIKDFDASTFIKKIQDEPGLLMKNTNMNDVVDLKHRAMARVVSSKPIQNMLKEKKSVKPGTKALKRKPKKKGISSSKTHSLPSSDEEISLLGNAVTQSSDEEGFPLERTHCSLFVSSMAALSEEASKNTTKKTQNSKKKAPSKKSNRLGQRARQRLWQEKYGKNARHMKTSTKLEKKDLKRTKQDKYKAKPKKEFKSNTREQEDAVSHPSWEASKRRKLEHNISQTQFQGKKIVFDD